MYLDFRGRVASHLNDPLYMATVAEEVILQRVTTFVGLVRQLDSAVLKSENMNLELFFVNLLKLFEFRSVFWIGVCMCVLKAQGV